MNLLARPSAKVVVFLACLAPGFWLVYLAFTGGLGANPIEYLTHETGKWGLIFLIACLFVTPLKEMANLKVLMRYRRMLGLFNFFYCCTHLSIYWVFDQSLSLRYVWDDIKERPYITLGFSGWLILLVLALTSPRAAKRKLGKKWLSIHQSVYVAAILATLHYIWLIRSDYEEVIIYTILVAVLLSYRLLKRLEKIKN